MVVAAEDDPPRKRSRLSLKSSLKKEDAPLPLTQGTHPPPSESEGTVPQIQGPLQLPDQELSDGSAPVLDLTESDLPSDGPGVPPVASMENLGNTCFLNSVLEVLRYTPCFLEGLEELYRHIMNLEKIKSSEVVQNSQEVKTEPSLAWELVKTMFKMYKRMEKREEHFSHFASADVSSMAVKPDKVLHIIREFNPMFEGHMQHDAQELLKCLLCYLEDSERQLHSDYAGVLALDPSLLKTPAKLPQEPAAKRKIRNPVMEKFLHPETTKAQQTKKEKSAIMSLKFDSVEAISPDSMQTDIKPAPLCERSFVTPPSEGKVTKIHQNQSSCLQNSQSKRWRVAQKRAATLTNGVSLGQDEKLVLKVEPLSNGISESPVAADTINIRRSGRKRVLNAFLADFVQPKERVRNGPKVNGKESSPTHEPVIRPKMSCHDYNGEGLSADVGCNGFGQDIPPTVDKTSPVSVDTSSPASVDTSSQKSVLGSLTDSSQPTIVSLFSRRSRQCRRLGMTRRVVQKKEGAVPSDATSPPLSHSSEVSPELRRSPRRCNTVRPVSMTTSPSKQNEIHMISPTSPARPDDVLIQVDRHLGLALEPPFSEAVKPCTRKSPIVGWNSHAQNTRFAARNDVGSASLFNIPEASADSYDGGEAVEELPDLVPFHTDVVSSSTSPVLSAKADTVKETPEAKDIVSGCNGKSSPSSTDQESTRSSASTSPLSWVGSGTPGGKLMIKLQKCDHLCNTSSISASAAMKAMTGPASSKTSRKAETSPAPGCSKDVPPIHAEVNEGMDSDEDEESLGSKASFKSVPLKSVCLKVEKCDMVCSSPDKSVSARFAASYLARQRAQRFNMIEKLFQGTMVNLTKCLECERCTQRQENFQDVSVPLKGEGKADSDSESEEDRDSCLQRLMHAFTDVEHLRDDNKYYCEQCFRYVEAERSLHYEALPNILSVQLKRFSATGMFGYLSKINDHVAVPLQLSCLRYKCSKPCSKPEHKYILFAIITHAGSTISCGHYLAYIKVRPNAVGNDTLSAYLSDSTDKSQKPDPFSSPLPTPSPLPQPAFSQTRDNQGQAQPVSVMGDGGDASSSVVNVKREEGEGKVDGGEGGERDPSLYHWLECDDETIRILSEKEFHSRLTEKEGALRGTPYLLFYHRLDTWKAKV